MNILVINGSPKGKYSSTIQTVFYLEKLHPEHEFHILHASKEIKEYVNDFSKAITELKWAELILFSTPVYSFLVPSQLHAFIDQMKKADIDYSNKFASVLTTSKHFYDVTAHQFMLENCQDMKLKYIKGLSADMDDLLKEKGQKDAINFFDYLMWAIEHDLYEPVQIHSTSPKHKKIKIAKEKPSNQLDKKVMIVADMSDDDKQLKDMIESFQAGVGCKTQLINIHNFEFEDGCINCFDCVATGKCRHKDGFDGLLQNVIQSGDAIVIAFSIEDHSFGQILKTYDDRQFVNGHRAVTMGKPFGYIVSGNLSEENNLRTIIEARSECGGNFLAGIVCDEKDPDGEMKKMIETLRYALTNDYIQPANFYGVGGGKIFRDLVWQMRGIMKMDYQFYKEHGQLDFPQYKPAEVIKGYFAGILLCNPKIKEKIGENLDIGMIQPYQKVIDSIDKK